MSMKRSKRSRRMDRRWIVVGVVAVVSLVVVLIAANWVLAPQSMASSAEPVPASALSECGGPSCGQADAPVTIEIYSDFQCPYCKQADAILQQIAPQYFDTGKARLVYKNMPIIGPESQPAAEAALCAGDQDKFWMYANYLFARQGNENSGVFSRSNLKAFASSLGLDTGQFNTCLDSGKYTATVRQQAAEAQRLGVTGTPTFFINGKRYEGVLPAERLASIIDAGQR